MNLFKEVPHPDPWFWCMTTAGSPSWNMAFDEAMLLNATALKAPLVRFYTWTLPCATFGYFQQLSQVESQTSLRPLVRRPTGGGIVPHGTDWTYSIAFPSTHPHYQLKARESYCGIHRLVKEVLSSMGIVSSLASAGTSAPRGLCFARPEENDVMHASTKIAGAAQRRSKAGLLIQGSVQPPKHVQGKGSDWIEEFRKQAEIFCQVQWSPWEPDDPFSSRVEELVRVKYGNSDFIEKR